MIAHSHSEIPEYVTVARAAEILKMNEHALRKLCWANKIPSVRIGRAVRIPVSALHPDNLAPVKAGEDE